METICHPAADRCRITWGLKGPEITSRTRSKYAIASLRGWFYGRLMSNSVATFPASRMALKLLIGNRIVD